MITERDEIIPPEWYWKQMAVEGYGEQNCKNEIIGNREYIQVLEDRTNRYEQEIKSLRAEVRKWSDRYYSLWVSIASNEEDTRKFSDWADEVNEMYREEE